MNDELRTVAIRVLIICVAVTWLVILWRADRNPLLKNFSIIGYLSTKDGFPDRPGTMEIGSWVALTMALVVLVTNDKLTEWFVLIYAGLPAIRAGQASLMRAYPAAVAPGTTTTTDTSKTVTQVTENAPKPVPVAASGTYGEGV